jgi:hypothetical protein
VKKPDSVVGALAKAGATGLGGVFVDLEDKS